MQSYFKDKGHILFVGKIILIFGSLLFLLFRIHMNYWVHPIAGTSMEEVLEDGDRVIINTRAPIDRYAIIGFSVAEEEGMFVKRVIGVPGDALLVQGNRLILSVDDQAFTTTYSFDLTNEAAQKLKSSKVIPSQSYFVIGDHVSVSKDSRSFGFVKAKKIEGKVQYKVYPLNEIGPIN